MDIAWAEHIEELAQMVRIRLFTYDQLPVDMATALTRIGDLGGSPKPSVEVHPDSRMKFDEAYTDGDVRRIHLSQTTNRGVDDGEPRSRFTAAHELGHLALGHRGTRSRALEGRDFRKAAGVRGVWQDEVDANSFASAFLMPAKFVRPISKAFELAKRCIVSEEAARNRIEALSRIERRRSGQLRELPANVLPNIEQLFKFAGRSPQRFSLPEQTRYQEDAAIESACL